MDVLSKVFFIKLQYSWENLGILYSIPGEGIYNFVHIPGIQEMLYTTQEGTGSILLNNCRTKIFVLNTRDYRDICAQHQKGTWTFVFNNWGYEDICAQHQRVQGLFGPFVSIIQSPN